MGKRKRADVYLEVRKRMGHIFFNETSACGKTVYLYTSSKNNELKRGYVKGF
jgi:hypothetical protein